MATLIELTKYYDINRQDVTPRKVTVNLDLVLTIERQPSWRDMAKNGQNECTVIWFGGRNDQRESVEVMEDTETIIHMAAGYPASPGKPLF